MTGSAAFPRGRPGEARWRIVVVGAGIAGLSCAARLSSLFHERGRPLALLVLDAAARPGGVIATERRDGFLIEAGPDCFITDKPWALDLCRRLGLEEEVIGTNSECRRSFVARRGRLVPIPEGYQLLAPSRLLPFATSSLLSLRGRLRVLCDILLARGPRVADESLACFVRRRFGSEALERMAQPLVAGIYDADPERLSLRATFPRFLEMERSHRSIILALLRGRRAGGARAGVSGARYSLFVTLRSGLQTLIDRLAASLPPGGLRLGARVASVARGAGPQERFVLVTAAGDRVQADAVALALPAQAAAPLLRETDRGLADALAAIPYGTAATINLAYRRADIPRPIDGFGFVVPRSERRALVACTFSSVKFAGRAPDTMVLLRAFFGGAAVQEPGQGAATGTMDDDADALEARARSDLRDILGVRAAPLFARTFVWPRAMAQYEVGHLDRVAAIEERLGRIPGLALAGNGLRGIGIPDCVRSGDLAAERLAAEVDAV